MDLYKYIPKNQFRYYYSALSAHEKERAIHDYIVKSVVYKDVEAPYSHEAPGTLLYRIGVCEGISKAVKWLCDRVDLKSIVAIGTSDSNGNSGGHAWNVVFLNGTPFHIDVTFDATLSNNSIRYDYFNLSELEILEDHKISNEYSLPACKHSRNWFKENNLFFHSKKELIFYLKNLEPTVKNFCFQIPIFINQKDNTTAIEETSKLIYSNLFDKQLSPSHSYTIKYNINRMVFEIDIH